MDRVTRLWRPAVVNLLETAEVERQRNVPTQSLLVSATAAQESESAAFGSLAVRQPALGASADMGALRGTPR